MARRRSDDGAAMVEFLLVVPVLLLLLVGVIEFGLVHRDRLVASTASRGGARVLSSGGNSRLADFDAVKAAEAALADLNTATLVRVVVFRPDATGAIPSTCLTNPVAGRCNHYGPGDLAVADTAFTGTTDCEGASPDRLWCPLDRVVDQGAGLTWIGFRVELEHESIAPMLPDRRIVADTIMRVEPRRED